MKNTKNCNFSFAGIKSQVKKFLKENPSVVDNEEDIRSLCYSFQKCVNEHLEDRLNRAIMWCQKNYLDMKSIVVSGGVACNQAIRSHITQVASLHNLVVHAPSPSLCRDNGSLIIYLNF